eukprot:1194834-Prorocentrum_minimum.AAC.7
MHRTGLWGVARTLAVTGAGEVTLPQTERSWLWPKLGYSLKTYFIFTTRRTRARRAHRIHATAARRATDHSHAPQAARRHQRARCPAPKLARRPRSRPSQPHRLSTPRARRRLSAAAAWSSFHRRGYVAATRARQLAHPRCMYTILRRTCKNELN